MKNRKQNQKGFSLIELLMVVAIILIIAAIAIPNLLQARVAANESSAVASLRTISTAQITYIDNFPTVGFAPVLANLGGTTCTTPDQNGACLIDSLLSSGAKSGYSFSEIGIGSAPNNQYLATGLPTSGNGNRSFCTTEDGVIHYDPTGSAISDHDSCLALTSLQ
ncbi:MAG: type II secretion system protein [Terriglobales bacterium]|jgi:prepilin-type N-terminal cleavage/methylation domain-containing protein